MTQVLDAAGLLWRIQLQEGDTVPRPAELAKAWAAHIDDDYCSFNDLHAMLAFVAARYSGRVQRLEQVLAQSQARPTRHGLTTRHFGLTLQRAVERVRRPVERAQPERQVCIS